MRILYLDCFAGISGDMFLSALLDAGLPFELLKAELDKLNANFEVEVTKVKRNGIIATRLVVKEEKVKRGLEEIVEIINKSKLELEVKQKAVKMFERLQAVEKKIHGEVHTFHELGLLDTIVDVVGAIVGLKILNVEKVFAGKVNVGGGFVNTEHGTVPVPAPATTELLKGIPVYSTGVTSELVTPTGALLLSEFVDEFRMPEIKIESVGYGAGGKTIKNFPNLLRVYLGVGESIEARKILIETNIDDLNPEIYEYVMERLFQHGALDVYLTPVHMKKNRPGILLSCLCREGEKEKLVEIIFQETSTTGLRVFYPERIELERYIKTVHTEYGEVEVKIAKYRGKIMSVSPEYETCKKIAAKKNIPLKEVYRAAIAGSGLHI
ncbi:MAG: nickel pincer cofactor biosynthesis protein LarC [Caldiserica bacterium]|nr:nickel pincer cofactor biosynthesis protein LarC [Caldisericota bacterium]